MAARPVSAAPSTVRADEQCAALYRRHGAEILRYCRRKLAEPADAEDVAQQVFVRAYGALLRGERVRLPRHWLLRIARNECRRFAARRRRVEEVGFDEAIDVAPVDEGAQWSPAEIRRALDELVPTQRQALVLRELEGRPYTEIARELRLTVSAVETLLFRARRSLREQLDGALACDAAEHALSLELDGRLPEDEKAGLRAHLRGCADCRRLARRQRAQRHALRTLLPVPLQGQLASVVGGGGTAAGTGGVVAKVGAAMLAAGAVTTGAGIKAAEPAPVPAPQRPAPSVAAAAAPATSRPPAAAQVRVKLAVSTPAPPTHAATAPAGAPAATAPAPSPTPTPTVTVAAASPEAPTAPAPQPEQQPTLVEALPLPVDPQLPPVQTPELPLEPPPLPPLPDLPPTPLDPVLPDLPGG
jgi:RNA polymerase sigma factor (sigma-70 family)